MRRRRRAPRRPKHCQNVVCAAAIASSLTSTTVNITAGRSEPCARRPGSAPANPGQPARLRIDRAAGLERPAEGWARLTARRRSPGRGRRTRRRCPDQAAATNRNQQRVDLGGRRSSSRPSVPWPMMRFLLVEGWHRHGAGCSRPVLAGRQRVGIALALDAARRHSADARQLGRRGDLGTKIFACCRAAWRHRRPQRHGCRPMPRRRRPGTSPPNRLVKAPRALNEPECCSSSSLSVKQLAARPNWLHRSRSQAFA